MPRCQTQTPDLQSIFVAQSARVSTFQFSTVLPSVMPTFCRAMLQGISKMTMAMKSSWLPKLMVSRSTLISLANPPVRALAIFIRSSWKTRRPRKRRGRTEESTLRHQVSVQVLAARIGMGRQLAFDEPSPPLQHPIPPLVPTRTRRHRSWTRAWSRTRCWMVASEPSCVVGRRIKTRELHVPRPPQLSVPPWVRVASYMYLDPGISRSPNSQNLHPT